MRRGSPTGPSVDTAVEAVDAAAPAGDLLLVAGDGQLQTFPLTGAEVRIGRGVDCDVVIDHRALSRRHALLRLGAPPTVQDLGSTNGTRVGARTVTGGAPVELGAADGFQIGPFVFMLVGRGAPGGRAASDRDLLRVSDPTPTGVPAIVRDVARSDVSVLVLGETGVGKEVLAATLHALSGRPGPLTRLNCAALSEALLESELFGHEKGAFTGATTQRLGLLEASAGGTVFLDEVGELPLTIQAKLLRAVEQREVLRLGATRPKRIEVRFVAATNRDLPAEVAAGRFRRDLYFRLDGVTLEVPPLRDRPRAIVPLALEFLAETAARSCRPPHAISQDALAALGAYRWPGNVRELRAVIERAVLLAQGGGVEVRHLAFTRHVESSAEPPAPPAIAARPPPPAPTPTAIPTPPFDELPGGSLRADELADRERLVRALDECAGNQTRAARALGISRTTLVNKVRLYRIPRPRG